MLTIDYILKMLATCHPGQSIAFDKTEFPPGVGEFSGPDLVLEHVVGSAYEWGYEISPVSQQVTFYRREAPLPPEAPELTYVSPDRRHLYAYDAIQGLYRRNDKPHTPQERQGHGRELHQ